MTIFRSEQNLRPGPAPWQKGLFRIVFESDTPGGRRFDITLLFLILFSVLVVCLETVSSLQTRYGPALRAAEWVFTITFTLEYVVRLAVVSRPRVYATSFFGLVDLIAALPAYLSLLFSGSQYLLVVRSLRLLRVFRILKLAPYIAEGSSLAAALAASRRKIFVFLAFVLTAVLIIGALMYQIEGPQSGFTSIPISVYWAIVTLTTVGYGDIAPETPLGRFVAGLVMILGYGVIAVPTGIVTVELAAGRGRGRVCSRCNVEGHEPDAKYCKYCGEHLAVGVEVNLTK